MTSPMIHQPRVAWDGALALVTACENNNVFPWFKAEIWQLMGPALYNEVIQTHLNLIQAADERVHQVEAGKWRARLDELLRIHPDLATPMLTLIGEVREHSWRA